MSALYRDIHHPAELSALSVLPLMQPRPPGLIRIEDNSIEPPLRTEWENNSIALSRVRMRRSRSWNNDRNSHLRHLDCRSLVRRWAAPNRWIHSVRRPFPRHRRRQDTRIDARAVTTRQCGERNQEQVEEGSKSLCGLWLWLTRRARFSEGLRTGRLHVLYESYRSPSN